MSAPDNFLARARRQHRQAEWYDAARCERTDSSSLCHCHKRWRERRGFIEMPTDDLEFPPPSCPSCDADLWHDGDGWRCNPCALSWDSSGAGSSAERTDIYGNDTPCVEHGRAFCWHCEQKVVSA